jgi:hypothetical protein
MPQVPESLVEVTRIEPVTTCLQSAIGQLRRSVMERSRINPGVPSIEEMHKQYFMEHQPRGAWHRNTTFQWMERIRFILDTGTSALLEGQMPRAAAQIQCFTEVFCLP